MCWPTPRNVQETVLLLMPRDFGEMPVCPRKSLCDRVAAGFQGLWQITTHIWHHASPPVTLFQHQQMWLFSWVHWELCHWGSHTASTRCPPHRGPASPVWPKEPWTSLCSWGFALPTRAPSGIQLWSFRLCTPPVYSLNGL